MKVLEYEVDYRFLHANAGEVIVDKLTRLDITARLARQKKIVEIPISDGEVQKAFTIGLIIGAIIQGENLTL